MLLKEDFFKDIEITDDDIHTDKDEITSEFSPADYFDSLYSKYGHTLWLTVNDFIDDDNHIAKFNLIKKKLEYFLDTMNIEHSEVFIVEGGDIYDKSELRCYNYGNFKFFSEDEEDILSSNGKLKKCYAYRRLFIVTYINFPVYISFKKAYVTTYRLLSMLWKNDYNYRIIQRITMTYPPCFVEDFKHKDYKDNSIGLLRLFNHDINDVWKTINGITIIDKFRDIMKYFFGDHIAKTLIDKIYQGYKIF